MECIYTFCGSFKIIKNKTAGCLDWCLAVLIMHKSIKKKYPTQQTEADRTAQPAVEIYLFLLF